MKLENYRAKADRPNWARLGVIWMVLLAAPYLLAPAGIHISLVTSVLIYGLAAMAVNLLLGFTGGLSFGHAAYFGLGAYGTGLALKYLTQSTPLAIIIGVLVGGLAAVVFGLLCVRRRGIYFAMITIAIGQMFYFIAVRWNRVTGGEDGLTGFARTPIDLGLASIRLDDLNFYYLTLLCFAIGVGFMGAILRTPLGHAFQAIRDNFRRARFLGISVSRSVWISFGLSGFVTALAGSLNGLLYNFASPADLHWMLSGEFVIMAVLGGMRTFWGPLVGAAIFVIAKDYLSSLTGNWMSLIGLLFIIVVLAFPLGVLGVVGKRRAG